MTAFYNAAPHIVRITNQGFGESKQKKTPFFFLEFTPIAELRDGFKEQVDGRYSRTVQLYLTDKTIDYFWKQIATLGFSGGGFRDIDPMVNGHYSFTGVETEMICSHEENGYEKWELPFERAASAPKESDAGMSRKLDALFGKSKGSPKQPTPKRETVPPTNGGSKGDDIPF